MPSQKKPNIILLCPDEMRASALGCMGNPAGATPYLDGLAKRSVKFNRCFTNHPKCTPSRCSLLTGQYPHVGGHRTLEMPVRSHEVNLVRTLKESGYQTALVGKNHCVDEQTMPLTFDVDKGKAKGADTNLDPPDPPPMPIGTYYVGEENCTVEEHSDHLATTTALACIDDFKKDDQPFFLWLNWDHPHCPYRVPAPYFGKTDRDAVPAPLPRPNLPRHAMHDQLRASYGLDEVTADDWRELAATYLDMCSFIDDEVKRVIDHLEASGLADDTIVIFWSDHGDFAGDYELPEKWDTCFTDNLVHIPLLIHAPGRVTPQTVEGFIETIDVLPTALALAGVELPGGIQGKSYTPVLDGKAEKLREYAFCQGGQEPELLELATPVDARPRPCRAYYLKQTALVANPQINLRAKMLRGDRWKYIMRADGEEELYDLANDPGELTNLTDNPSAKDALDTMRLAMMRKLIEAESVDPAQDYLDS